MYVYAYKHVRVISTCASYVGYKNDIKMLIMSYALNPFDPVSAVLT